MGFAPNDRACQQMAVTSAWPARSQPHAAFGTLRNRSQIPLNYVEGLQAPPHSEFVCLGRRGMFPSDDAVPLLHGSSGAPETHTPGAPVRKAESPKVFLAEGFQCRGFCSIIVKGWGFVVQLVRCPFHVGVPPLLPIQLAASSPGR